MKARLILGCSLVSSLLGAALCYFSVARAAPIAPVRSPSPTIEVDHSRTTVVDNGSGALTLAAIDNLRTELLAKIEAKSAVDSNASARAEVSKVALEARAADRAEAGEQASNTVRLAMQAGVWQQSDRDVLRQTLGKLDDDACLAIQRDLANAINERRIKVAFAGPPW